MGEKIKRTGNEAVERWQQKMPKFFRYIMWVCVLICGTATAVHVFFTQFGITPHDWWLDILPYLTGIPFGMAFMCKFTVDGGFRQKQMDNIQKRANTVLYKDDF